jgi:hypothetical protein
METHFLLAFSEEKFLAPLAMTGSEVFFNKLLSVATCYLLHFRVPPEKRGYRKLALALNLQ